LSLEMRNKSRNDTIQIFDDWEDIKVVPKEMVIGGYVRYE